MKASPAPILDYSPLDSERFGRRIFRANLAHIDAATLREALKVHRVDTLILRIPADKTGGLVNLLDVGLAPIYADTQVHYETALHDHALRESAVRLVPAGSDDAAQLRTLARSIFADYSSHYAANPLLAAAAIADGYADWAVRLLGAAHHSAWFVYRDDVIVGFSACHLDAAARVARGVLNGIHPGHRGAGNYREMLHAMLRHARESAMDSFVITTQVHNIAVQRAWASAGLKLQRVDSTIHINSNFG